MDYETSIRVVRKSGKTKLGIKNAIKLTKLREAKAIIVASNTPEEMLSDLKYYANLSKVPIINFPKTSQELGILCGRAHLTSTVSIIEEGESDILDFIDKEE